MTVDELIAEYRKRFPRNGKFCLASDELVSGAVIEYAVPDEFGVYVISALKDDASEVVYIGKAGTIETDGRSKKQGLRRRLKMKQGGLSRNEFFKRHIKDNALNGLHFQWFVTFQGDASSVLPAFAEAELIQTYFNEYSRLPNWNRFF